MPLLSVYRYGCLVWLVYLAKWFHHEVALVHQRMRNLQVWLVDRQVVEEQDVDVNRSVSVLTVRRLLEDR